MADFVTVLYNPASQRRRWQLREAFNIFLTNRRPDTPVGHVQAAHRRGQQVGVTTLAAFDPDAAGMLSTIIIGNSQSRHWRGRLITPRGYGNGRDAGDRPNSLPRQSTSNAARSSAGIGRQR